MEKILITKHDENKPINSRSLLNILLIRDNNISSSTITKNHPNNQILSSIIQFMDLKDIITLKLLCKTLSYQISDKIIKDYIKKVGMLNTNIRESFMNFWLKFSNYHK